MCEAQCLIEYFIFTFNLSPKILTEIEGLIHKLTEGEYWSPVLIGACVHVVLRKGGKLILPLVQVADVVGRHVYELGSMHGCPCC